MAESAPCDGEPEPPRGPRGGAPERLVRVWDLPTRLVHWLLVVLVALTWFTGADEGLLYLVHTYAGYLLLLLLLFRFAWGAAGGEHARFAAFVQPWAEVRAYTLRLLRFAPPRFIGHNPLGGWMVVLLLVTLWVVTITGLVAAGGIDGALLAPLVPGFIAGIFEEIHEGAANLLLLLIMLHIGGVVADWLITGENLIMAMIDGRKAVAADSPAADARRGSAVVAVLAVVALAVIGYLLVGYTSF